MFHRKITDEKLGKQRHFDQSFVWYKTINEQIRSMMKSGTTQEKLLVVMDNFITSLKTNLNTFIRNANKCLLLANAISGALFLFKDLNRTSTETHEYLLKICELLSFYTVLELKFSSKFDSSKVIIAERISSNYNIHLKDVNIFYTLRVFLCIPTLFNEKEIMSKIFQKYLNNNQNITQTEIPDRLYCMYLIAYSKWKSLESDYYERIKICESANKNIKPMDTLCTNKSYAPFLPVYMNTDSDVTKYILSNHINVTLLTRELKYDACRKENVTLIDLSESDTPNAPIILNDTSWTNILSSDQKHSSVKLELPSVIATIDLTEEQPSSWEVSWLNELLRKARSAMPAIALNVFPSKLVDTNEVILIQDDDDDNCIVANNELTDKLSTDSNEIEENLNSTDRLQPVKDNVNIKNGCVNEKIPKNERQNKCNQNNNEKINLKTKKSQKEEELMESINTISNIDKTNNKSYNRKIDDEISSDSSITDNDKYTAAEKTLETDQICSSPYTNQSNSTIIFSTSQQILQTNSTIPHTEKNKSTYKISTHEDSEDINSPPVECFSESDADEIVQLIDKNTKESNLFGSRGKRVNSISQSPTIPNSNTVALSNTTNPRRVTFAKLPEKHIATSSHFTPKNIRNMEINNIIKDYNDSTKLSSINKILNTSNSNFNQPKRNTSENTSKTNSVHELVTSDCTNSTIVDINRQNKVSGTIGTLFMMKFPQPTYQKLENRDILSSKINHNIANVREMLRTNYQARDILRPDYQAREMSRTDYQAREILRTDYQAREMLRTDYQARDMSRTDYQGREMSRTDYHAREMLRTDFNKPNKQKVIQQNDNKQYVAAPVKKEKSDFDKYLENIRAGRNKKSNSKQKKSSAKNPPQSHIITPVQNRNCRKTSISYDTFTKRNVLQFIDKKIYNSYVKVERINISRYLHSKLNNVETVNENKLNNAETVKENKLNNVETIKERRLHNLETVKENKLNNAETVKRTQLYDAETVKERKLNNIETVKHQLSTFENAYVRIKRIKNIKEKKIMEIGNTDKTNQNILSCENTPKEIPFLNNKTEFNATYNNIYNIASRNQIEIENNNRKCDQLLPLIKVSKSSSVEEFKNEQIVISESENPRINQNILNSVIGYTENESPFKLDQLKDPENEVSSTQDNNDIIEEYEISSSQDITNKEINNSVQNNEIDTSQQILVRRRKKRKSPIDSLFSSPNKKVFVPQESNFMVQSSVKNYLNNEINLPTTTTLNLSAKQRGHVLKRTVFRKNNKMSTVQNTYLEDYKSENSTIAKTYSIHNLVNNVFVPPEVEKNFDELN